jgi:hypothetical protein
MNIVLSEKRGEKLGALQRASFLLTFSGVFAVPAGKGKLEKISVRKSSSCDK